MREQIGNRVLEVINSEFNFNFEVTQETPIEDLGFDSIDHIELLMELEEEFDMEISDEEYDKVILEGKKVSDLTDALYTLLDL